MTEARYQVNTYGAHWSSVDMGSLLSSCPARQELAHPARQVLEQVRTAMTRAPGTKCINEGCCEDAKQLHGEAAGLTVHNGAIQGFGGRARWLRRGPLREEARRRNRRADLGLGHAPVLQ